MSSDGAVPPDRTERYARLTGASPAERVDLVLELIERHPEHRLELPADGHGAAVLNDVNLSRAALQARRDRCADRPAWWDAELGGLRLRGADLRGASLRQADLSAAALERADLRGADLAASRLTGAALGGADLRDAMLEDASLARTGARFANFERAVLENADLAGADLWGARLVDAVLINADLRGATVIEADLSGADASNARLDGADLRRTDLRRARLAGASLRGVNLRTCDVGGVYLDGAWLEKTQLEHAQLGPAIGEEVDRRYEAARRGYVALERNFLDLGDSQGASWAYRRRRRMQKLAARDRAGAAWSAGDRVGSARAYAAYASDQSVEWLCDYGESVWRVLGALTLLYLAFTLLYLVTGSVVRLEDGPAGAVKVPTYDLLDVATFSLLALSTSGSPAVGLLPREESVHLLTATEALLGIALTGLLGFVLGNRIRR